MTVSDITFGYGAVWLRCLGASVLVAALSMGPIVPARADAAPPAGAASLDDVAQMDLFNRPASARLDHTLDAVRKRFGHNAIRRGAGGTLRDLDWRGDDLRSVSVDDDR